MVGISFCVILNRHRLKHRATWRNGRPDTIMSTRQLSLYNSNCWNYNQQSCVIRPVATPRFPQGCTAVHRAKNSKYATTLILKIKDLMPVFAFPLAKTSEKPNRLNNLQEKVVDFLIWLWHLLGAGEHIQLWCWTTLCQSVGARSGPGFESPALRRR